MNTYFNTKREFINEFKRILKNKYLKEVNGASNRELYNVLSLMIMDYSSDNWISSNNLKNKDNTKEIYYFSMEFLLGRLTNNNVEALNISQVIKDSFKELNISYDDVIECEKDPGLGNGGLGRLAACYFDSLSSLRYPAMGNTIRYKYGLFKQRIKNGYQEERPDDWLTDNFNYEIRRDEEAVEIPLYGYVENLNGKRVYHPSEYIKAVPYDVPIIGYRNNFINTLRLWNAEPAKKYPLNKSAFDYETDLRKICGFLYPDDSSDDGKRLRLIQQYFFSSAGLRTILNKEIKKYGSLDRLYDHAVIHLNDTHPTILIPEMMRILLDEYNFEWVDAYNIVSKTVCYTNHSLLKEVMESWNIPLFRSIFPRVMEIIDEINRRFVDGLYSDGYDKKFVDEVAIIKGETLYMASLCLAVSFKVNGVAKLHTELIKTQEMKEFDYLFKDKIVNVTNGVTPRRWVMNSNKELSSLLDKYASGWRDDFNKVSIIESLIDSTNILNEFIEVKNKRKEILSSYINSKSEMINKLDTSFIFDVQVKRLHEYKRQLLNAIHIIYLMNRLEKDTEFRNNYTPHAFIFGAKAASGYYFAKKIIKLINTISSKIDNSELLSKYIKVIFIENYGVSISELINPAVEISEQISLASYEASGTGNMKAMMNGSITIGTLDGANVEINELVGDDNMVLFGLTKDEVRKNRSSYNPKYFYDNNKYIKDAVDSLINGYLIESDTEFREIYDKLLNQDTYMVLADFESYRLAQERINDLYKDKFSFYRKCLINTARSTYFSSDRSIEEYAANIWKIKKL